MKNKKDELIDFISWIEDHSNLEVEDYGKTVDAYLEFINEENEDGNKN